MIIFRKSLRRGVGGVLALVCWLAGAERVWAQSAVTSVTYNAVTDTANVTTNGITYLNQNYTVNTVSTSGTDYYVDGQMASAVYFRRNTSGWSSTNNSSVFYQYSSVSTYYNNVYAATVYGNGDSTPTLSEVMLSNNLTEGLRNPFANTGDSTSELSNIERIDFYFAGGHVVTADDAIILFDLENVGNYGDGFRIAAITGWDTSTATATAYANTGLLIDPGTMGEAVASPTGTNATYLRTSTTSGDSLSSGQSVAVLDSNSSSSADLYLVGIVIKLTDLGLTVGSTIYGYSLMAGDVSATTSASLVDWTNTTVYSTSTDASSWGNVDFMGFGGQLARPVPEPAVTGAVLILLAIPLARLLRRRRH